MENTAINKVERMVENFMISMAIQDAINQKALHPTKEQKAAIDLMIATLANHFKAAEA
jgi:hypothetical protein